MSRLFAAILPDDPFRDALETLAGGAVTLAGGGKVTPRENFHLTLAFLGETSRQEAALEGLMAVEAPAFSLELGRVDSFPAIVEILSGRGSSPVLPWLSCSGSCGQS